jgi:hypothetical protein
MLLSSIIIVKNGQWYGCSARRKRVHSVVMNIYLTNHANVRLTKFCAAEGQVLYKSETPGFLQTGKKTKIYKVIPNDEPEDMSMFYTFISPQPRPDPQLLPICLSGQIYTFCDYRMGHYHLFEIDI